ncbi:MAG: hypothetical protein WKF97_03505 [Chitinophagaceae bacterium]
MITRNQRITSDENFADSTFRSYTGCINKYPGKYFDMVLIDGRSTPALPAAKALAGAVATQTSPV